MIVIDGKDAVLGRLASLAAKEALKGEEVAVVNCEHIIITGNKQRIKEDLEHRKRKIGSKQAGPKYSVSSIKFVKRTIRGMLPNPRHGGRGRDAFKKIKCYNGIPKEFEHSKKIEMKENKIKFTSVRELMKK